MGGAAETHFTQYLAELRRRIHHNHIQGGEVTDRELIEFAAKGMLSGLDPHST